MPVKIGSNSTLAKVFQNREQGSRGVVAQQQRVMKAKSLARTKPASVIEHSTLSVVDKNRGTATKAAWEITDRGFKGQSIDTKI